MFRPGVLSLDETSQSYLHPWFNAIRRQYVAQCCASCIKMAQFGSIICITHPNGSILCITHQRGCTSCFNMVWCCASTNQCCASGIIMQYYIAHCCSGFNLWPNVVHQASQYGANLHVHHVSEWLYRCGASLAQAVHMHQYGLIQHDSSH